MGLLEFGVLPDPELFNGLELLPIFAGGFLKKLWKGIKKVPIVGGVAKGAESGIRGLGNVVSGDWDKNVLGDLMGGLGAAGTVLGVPGLFGAGPLGGLLGGVGGRIGGALQSAGGLLGLGKGGGGLLGGLGGGGGGALGNLLGLGSLGLGVADVIGANKQRKSAQNFQQGQLDALSQFMGKGEASWDKRQGLRDDATAKIQQGMKRPGVFAKQLGL